MGCIVDISTRTSDIIYQIFKISRISVLIIAACSEINIIRRNLYIYTLIFTIFVST